MAIISGSVAGVLALAVVAGALISYFGRIQVDSREPPVVHPKIPFIGHLIGMIRHGPLYFTQVSSKVKAPIFTLPVLGNRTYVCGSPALTAAIQRASATLDFDELIVHAMPRFVGLSKEAAEILKDPTATTEGSRRVVEMAHSVINPPLQPQNMEDLTMKQLKNFSDYFNGIRNDQEFKLYHMATRAVAFASMDTFYGPKNPFKLNNDLMEDFFVWETDVVPYMVGFFPSIFVRKATQALSRMGKSFEEYINNGHVKEAHALIQSRQALHEDAGISIPDQGRLEVGLSLAFNVNAGITTFWILDNIYSRPELLEEIRREVRENAITAPGTISYAKLKDSCHLLASVYRETMRINAPMNTARWVKEDIVIADTYLLRKGSVVQAAGGIMHWDPELWGEDVHSFNPRRFWGTQSGLKNPPASDQKGEGKTSQQVHAAAFRAFGGGASMCPGRFFAQMEIMSLVAVVVSGFDILPPQGKEKVDWNPARDDTKFPFAVSKPVRDIDVRFRRREGMEDLEWKLDL
ncbi:cytochrome P450 [Periconia macrospinosa]|uniref:Cytochrome P450 n=1 Tax=Periconia macrospinosa TaxID=97972 RepID=A0A2V1DT74_9PLEO|nr:cytochrome P450 [Periconia macrospinosa]